MRLYHFQVELNGLFIAAIRTKLDEIQSQIIRLWNRDNPEEFDPIAIAWLISEKRAYNEELQERLEQQLMMVQAIIDS